MAIVPNITPDNVVSTEYGNRKIEVNTASPVALAIGDLLVVASFKNRIATADGASSATIVKVNSAGTDSAIVDGDNLAGFDIAYKASSAIAKGDTIVGNMGYWSSL